MILNKIGYSYNDLTLVPNIISKINTRSQCDPFIDSKLPIFTAPMASVVNDKNYKEFIKNGIMPIIPRNINIEIRKEMMEYSWIALSLNEFKELFINKCDEIKQNKTYHICIDIANGHMESLYEICAVAKDYAISHNYILVIMIGNIANPETYKWICKFNDNSDHKIIDYIRIGIGGGSGCFVDGTKIKMENGEKNIEDINPGDKVLTMDGTYQKVLNTLRYKTNELIKINNEIISTTEHKYFVINKEDKNKVNDNNLNKYGYWVEANKLDKNKHLLIKKYV